MKCEFCFTAKIFILLFIFSNNLFSSHFNFKSNSSTIKINSGANFCIDNQLDDFKGTIIKDEDANIYGQDVVFNEGNYRNKNSKVKFSGNLSNEHSQEKIKLNGNKIFTGKRGDVLESIEISGNNNRLEGEFKSKNDIVLLDLNTSLTIDYWGTLDSNLCLNGGMLNIDGSLSFADYRKIIGPGIVALNSYNLSFGAKDLTFENPIYFDSASDITLASNLNLAANWTFSGNNILNGNHSVLCLDNGGKIIIERGSSLLFKNLTLHGVGDGNIFCMDDNCTITFQNTKIYLNSDYTFSTGRFEILDEVVVSGNNNKFTYNSALQSKILSKAILGLDGGITFSYDPGVWRKDLISFEDNLATLKLSGSTVHITLTGMQLLKGNVIIKQHVFVNTEKNDDSDEGIIIGNDSIDDDCMIHISGGSKLELLSGTIKYKNINSTSWFMENNLSSFELNSDCNLYIYQDIDLGTGVLKYKGKGCLYYVPGKKINGTMNASERIYFFELD